MTSEAGRWVTPDGSTMALFENDIDRRHNTLAVDLDLFTHILAAAGYTCTLDPTRNDK